MKTNQTNFPEFQMYFTEADSFPITLPNTIIIPDDHLMYVSVVEMSVLQSTLNAQGQYMRIRDNGGIYDITFPDGNYTSLDLSIILSRAVYGTAVTSQVDFINGRFEIRLILRPDVNPSGYTLQLFGSPLLRRMGFNYGNDVVVPGPQPYIGSTTNSFEAIQNIYVGTNLSVRTQTGRNGGVIAKVPLVAEYGKISTWFNYYKFGAQVYNKVLGDLNVYFRDVYGNAIVMPPYSMTLQFDVCAPTELPAPLVPNPDLNAERAPSAVYIVPAPGGGDAPPPDPEPVLPPGRLETDLNSVP